MSTQPLTIRLFGAIQAHARNHPLRGLHLREGERLLAYLSIRHGCAITYRQLAQQFWPAEANQNDQFESGDFPSTRQAIYSLRQALGEESWRLASAGKGVVQFNLEGADVDLIRFEQLVQLSDAASMKEALLLHHAPLLDRWPEKWAAEARTRCQRSYDRVIGSLAALPEAIPAVTTAAPAPVNSKLPPAGKIRESEGGAVPLDSIYYVERPTDGEFGSALQRGDSIVLVKGARQVGKTSLLARQLQAARASGARVVLTDFQKLNADQLASPNALYLALATTISMQLNLDVSPHKEWDPDHGPNMNLEWFLRKHVLRAITGQLVWAMDEMDRLFSCPFGSEVFGLLRSWHNERSLDPLSPWSRLTLAIAYATEAHLFITDLNQSPFNVGTRLSLDDFSRQQISELNVKYGAPIDSDAGIDRFHALVGGQPYLCRRGLDALAVRGLNLDDLDAEAAREDGVFGDHLRRLVAALSQSPDLKETIKAMLSSKPCPSGELFYRLRAAGVLSGPSSHEARFRCRLYENHLANHLK